MTDVRLDPGVYWRLRYLQRDVEACEAEGRLQAMIALDRYHAALRAAHVDPGQAYRWRDDDTTLDGTTDGA